MKAATFNSVHSLSAGRNLSINTVTVRSSAVAVPQRLACRCEAGRQPADMPLRIGQTACTLALSAALLSGAGNETRLKPGFHVGTVEVVVLA